MKASRIFPRIAVATALLAAFMAVILLSPGARTQAPGNGLQAALGLELVRDVPLPGSATRLDYQSIDQERRLLFIAHLGGDAVIVVNVDSLAVVRQITGVPRPHGILAVPQLGRVYVSATGKDQVYAIDEGSLNVIARIPAGHYPDGIAYDPGSKRLFVSDELGQTVAVIDAEKKSLIGKIDMGGEVGNTQYDPASGMIYSAVQTLDQIAEIDPANMEVTGRFRLRSCRGPHGFSIDPATHFAIITGEGNGTYVVFDLTSKTIAPGGKVGAGPDVLALDAGLRRVYVSSESGVVSVLDVRKGEVKKLGEAFLAANAHTVAVDQKTHLVFFPLQNIGGHPILRVMIPG